MSRKPAALYKDKAKALIKGALAHFDIRIVRSSYFESLTQEARKNQNAGRCLNQFEIIKKCRREFQSQAIDALPFSRSQIGQDLFVLSELKFKKNGYFVEFGATNGIDWSNSCILEKEFGWNGIVAEPARIWHEALSKNRQCHIETKCVSGKSGQQVEFNETETAELSTIKTFSDGDLHRERRQYGKIYQVETISLMDLIDKFPPPPRDSAPDAPRYIDYLSIDTEGSEYEILKDFDFNRYKFRIITCEHNFTPMREKIHALLVRNGYRRTFEALSQFDDWYVLR